VTPRNVKSEMYRLAVFALPPLYKVSEFRGMGAFSQVTERRTKADWAVFLQDIAATYPQAERITRVMDNLNTHTPGALYEAFALRRPRRSGTVLSLSTRPSMAVG
jgi:hypothetical protein